LKTIFGDYNQNPDAMYLYNQINNDGGTTSSPRSLSPTCASSGGRLWSPLRDVSVTAEKYASMPIMIYLPGLNGTGLAASRQFKMLMTSFEFSAFMIPVDGFDSLRQLVDDFVDMLTVC